MHLTQRLIASLCFVLISGLQFRNRRSIVSEADNNSAECHDNKDAAFFVVDNSRSNANIVATYNDISEEDCRILCSNNRDLKDEQLFCTSFTYDPNLFQCLIHDKKSVPDGVGILINEPGKRYSEKFCIDADLPSECTRTQFTRIQQAVIVGYAKNFSSASSTEECAMRCLRESFPCRSAMYFYEEGECITNSESAMTVPSAFAHENTDKVVYFQNGCEKVVENQKNITSEKHDVNDEDELKEAKKMTNELNAQQFNRMTNSDNAQLTIAMLENDTINEVISEEDAIKSINTDLGDRKPERVTIFKAVNNGDEKAESAEVTPSTTDKDTTKLVNMQGDANPDMAAVIKKLNHEKATDSAPEQVGVLPRVVYNEMIEEEKHMKNPQEDSLEQFRPHVVQPVVKESPSKLEQQKQIKLVNDVKTEQRTTRINDGTMSTEAFEMPKVIIQVTVNESNVSEHQKSEETTTVLTIITSKTNGIVNSEKKSSSINLKKVKYDGQDDIKGLLQKPNRTKIDLENESRGYFSEWNPWTVCKTVGERRIRRRRCLNLRKCIGALTEVAVCKPEDIKMSIRVTSPSSSNVHMVVSAEPKQQDEIIMNQLSMLDKQKLSSASGFSSSQGTVENPALWSPWDGNCKQFPKVQPCRDHQQIGYESRKCLNANPADCIGPFFRYCTIAC